MNIASPNSSSAVGNIRVICTIVFIAGIAGMIIASVAGNNVGVVNTIGGTTTVSALVLLAATTSSTARRPEIFDEADAERLERTIGGLINSGADERALRDVIRQAIRLGKNLE